MNVPAILRPRALQSCAGAAKYDFDSFILTEPQIEEWTLPGELLAYSTTLCHELVHWFQHHSTTVGLALSLIRYSQYQVAIKLASKLSPLERKMLGESLAGSKPLINLEQNLLNVLPSLKTEEARNFAQIWYDHSLVYASLYDSELQDFLNWPRSSVFGEVMADVGLVVNDKEWLTGLPGHREARRLYSLRDEPVFRAFKGRRITTRSVLEGAAGANELLTVMRYSSLGASLPGFSNLRDKIHAEVTNPDAEYSAILVPLIDHFSHLGLGFESALIAVALACDISLNPALPVICDIEQEGYSWEDVYPPARLLNLTYSLAEGELPDLAALSGADLISYAEKWAAKCGVPVGSSRFCSSTDVNLRDFSVVFSEASDAEILQFVDGKEYIDFVVWLHSQMCTLRTAKNVIPVAAGLAFSGPDSVSLLEVCGGFSREKHWMLPQLIVKKGGVIAGPQKSLSFRGWLLSSISGHSLTSSLLTGCRLPDLLDLPDSVLTAGGFVAAMKAAVSQMVKKDGDSLDAEIARDFRI